VLLRQLPSTSRFTQSYGGERFAWDVDTHLLATLVDLTAGGNWQRGGGKSHRPQPIQRPGQEKQTNSKQIGKARPLAEVRQILDNW
jgi:hypothetical protein